MLARIRKAQQDDGFTLIELLVVIIIIGILAAIAIPVFLNQRKKGYDAQTKSDIRNLATLEETYLTDNPAAYGTYDSTATPAAGTIGSTTYPYKISTATTKVVATPATNQSFKIKGDSSSGASWCYDSTGANGTGVYALPASGAC